MSNVRFVMKSVTTNFRTSTTPGVHQQYLIAFTYLQQLLSPTNNFPTIFLTIRLRKNTIQYGTKHSLCLRRLTNSKPTSHPLVYLPTHYPRYVHQVYLQNADFNQLSLQSLSQIVRVLRQYSQLTRLQPHQQMSLHLRQVERADRRCKGWDHILIHRSVQCCLQALTRTIISQFQIVNLHTQYTD